MVIVHKDGVEHRDHPSQWPGLPGDHKHFVFDEVFDERAFVADAVERDAPRHPAEALATAPSAASSWRIRPAPPCHLPPGGR